MKLEAAAMDVSLSEEKTNNFKVISPFILALH